MGSGADYKRKLTNVLDEGAGVAIMNGLLQDVRHPMRQQRKNAGFTLVAAITLALANRSEYALLSAAN